MKSLAVVLMLFSVTLSASLSNAAGFYVEERTNQTSTSSQTVKEMDGMRIDIVRTPGVVIKIHFAAELVFVNQSGLRRYVGGMIVVRRDDIVVDAAQIAVPIEAKKRIIWPFERTVFDNVEPDEFATEVSYSVGFATIEQNKTDFKVNRRKLTVITP